MNLTAPESLIFWTTIIFVVFLILLRKFAWKPILGAVRSREESIADALAAADNAKREMQNLQASNEKLLAEARAERDAMLKEAREMKEKIVAEAKNEAQAEGEKMIQQAKAAIENEKSAAMADIKNHVSGLSIEIAEKLMKNQLGDAQAQNQLVESLLNDVKLN